MVEPTLTQLVGRSKNMVWRVVQHAPCVGARRPFLEQVSAALATGLAFR